jgi:hypothetical protein
LFSCRTNERKEKREKPWDVRRGENEKRGKRRKGE